MSTDYFPMTSRWVIGRGVVDATLMGLARDGRDRREGIALWLGRRVGETARVSHVVRLAGPGLVTREDLLEVSAELFNEVDDVCAERGLVWLGQAHTHGGAWTGMSRTDRMFGPATPYFLSVIVPHFAQDARTTLADCGVHLLDPVDGWRTLGRDEVESRIDIANVEPEDAGVVITVGEGSR